jgi:ABC-2 type transport system permease protein/oleandomycin transport system permease protein
MPKMISDILIMTKRGILHYQRVPQLIVFSTIQPVMFLLLFVFVFGGAIKGSTGSVHYINFLLPGILVQTIMFGSVGTGIGLAADMQKGIVDRFRSLPMSNIAVVAGRTIADLFRNIFVLILMVIVGSIIGFRIEHGIFNFIGAMGLTLLFGFAFSWVSAAIGLAVKNLETAQVAGFIWMFPLAFASSIFVPIQTMPDWLQAFAKINPVTLTANSVRDLSMGLPVGNNIWQALLWIAFILIIAIPIAINRYRKIS